MISCVSLSGNSRGPRGSRSTTASGRPCAAASGDVGVSASVGNPQFTTSVGSLEARSKMGPGPHRRRRFRPPESTNAPEIPRRLPPLRWTRLGLIDGEGVLALVPPLGPDRGTRRLDDHDAYRTQPARAQARRANERSRVAADHGGNRRPTAPEAPATGRFPDQGRPVRSERSPPRVPDASARLARALQDAPAGV